MACEGDNGEGFFLAVIKCHRCACVEDLSENRPIKKSNSTSSFLCHLEWIFFTNQLHDIPHHPRDAQTISTTASAPISAPNSRPRPRRTISKEFKTPHKTNPNRSSLKRQLFWDPHRRKKKKKKKPSPAAVRSEGPATGGECPA